MTVSHSPAPARSDLPVEHDSPNRKHRPFLVHGRVLSIGALLWAASIAMLGVSPSDEPSELLFFGFCSGAFQVGLLFLLRALFRSNALGEGRLARFFIRFETGLVSLAIASTVVDAIGVSDLTQPGWLLLDAFWPFSMLGMFFIGIRIAVAGRWKGATRFWPMVAESWAVVCVPVIGIFGAGVAQWVGALHLVIGYNVLGILVSRKQA